MTEIITAVHKPIRSWTREQKQESWLLTPFKALVLAVLWYISCRCDFVQSHRWWCPKMEIYILSVSIYLTSYIFFLHALWSFTLFNGEISAVKSTYVPVCRDNFFSQKRKSIKNVKETKFVEFSESQNVICTSWFDKMIPHVAAQLWKLFFSYHLVK